jgi:hypothetical protein
MLAQSGDTHADVCTAVETGFLKLQEWLDLRLQHQEELLRRLSDAHECPSYSESPNKNMSGEALNSHDEDTNVAGSELREDNDVKAKNKDQLLKVSSDPASQHTPLRKAASCATEASEDGCNTASTKVGRFEPSFQHLQTVPLPGSIGTETFGTYPLAPHSQSLAVSPRAESDVSPPPDDPKRLTLSMSKRNLSAFSALDDDEIMEQDWQSKLMDIFDQLDLDSSGSIDRSEFTQAFEEVGLPNVKAFDVFAAIDHDHENNKHVIDRMEWLHVVEEAANSSEEEKDLIVTFIKALAKRQERKGRIYQGDRRVRSHWIIRHDQPFRMTWDLGMMILLFYISLTLPYSLGFGSVPVLEVIDRVFDCFFCVDVVLNFRTSYLDNEDAIVVDGKKIAFKYLRSWFLLDFMSSVPFDLVTAGLLPNLTPARLLKLGKIAKVMKLLRFSKMINTIGNSELFQKLEERNSSKDSQTVSRLVNLMVIAFLLAHELACFGAAVDDGHIESYFAARNEVPTRFQKYLAAMYGAMTTLTTVGYGDITPTSDSERFYAMFAMVVGGAFYGYIIGSVTSIVSDRDLNKRAFYSRMDLVQSWLDAHASEIPKSLRRRVRKHYKVSLKQQSAMEDSSVLFELSPELRADMAFFILHPKVRSNPMFVSIPNSALVNLVVILKKNHAIQHEYIVKIGDPGIAMYMLVDGNLRYDKGMQWRPEGAEVPSAKYHKMKEGDSFGEEILFQFEEHYKYTVVALNDCQLHSISEGDFKDQYRNMPELHDHMKECFLQSRHFPPEMQMCGSSQGLP